MATKKDIVDVATVVAGAVVDAAKEISEAEDILSQIEAAEEECEKAAAEYEAKNESAKAAKGRYVARVDELRRLCRIRKEPRPLFDQNPGEAWRSQRLDADRLEIQPSVLKSLEEAGIETAGQLADKMNGNPQWWEAADIRNIGEGRAAKLADVIGMLQREAAESVEAGVTGESRPLLEEENT